MHRPKQGPPTSQIHTHTHMYQPHMRSKIHLPFIIYCGVEKDNTLLPFR
jgi:hypothetical protein